MRVVSLFAAVDPNIAPSYDIKPCYLAQWFDCGGMATDGDLCAECAKFVDEFGKEQSE